MACVSGVPAKVAKEEIMGKQEEIRQWVEGCVSAVRNDRSPQVEALFKSAVDNILTGIRERGGVLKVERELPKVICLKKDECGYKHNCTHAVNHQDSWELCRHYSYNPCSCPKERVAVEPLIKEE